MCNYEHLSHAGIKLILQNYCCCPHVRKFNLQNLVEKEHTYNLPFSQLLSFSSHVRNLVFGTFWYCLATMLPKCYVIVYLIFLLSKARQAKRKHIEMKISQPIFGILVALTKNEVTKICDELGICYCYILQKM